VGRKANGGDNRRSRGKISEQKCKNPKIHAEMIAHAEEPIFEVGVNQAR
jgi:hypothetical protein